MRSKHSPLVIGIDLGGTNIGIGVVDVHNTVIGRERRKTKSKEGAVAVIDRIVEGVHRACDDAGVALKDIKAVGIATAGAIDIPKGIVLEAPNLKWYDLPLRDLLQRKLKRPVVVDNDVNGAIWGEFNLGAGQAQRTRTRTPARNDDVLGVWMGTGVGGGLVFNGQLFHGEFFTAGEVGQMVVVPDGRKGRRTVEDFCSRTGMSRTIQELLGEFPRSKLHQLTEGTGKITGSKQLAKAFKARDKLAVQVVQEAADMLGMAIANIITVLAIDTVIIGGGVSEALGKPYLKRIQTSFRQYVFPDRCQSCRFVLTQLKDDAGLLGAALLARQQKT
jgi:glucokinase